MDEIKLQTVSPGLFPLYRKKTEKSFTFICLSPSLNGYCKTLLSTLSQNQDDYNEENLTNQDDEEKSISLKNTSISSKANLFQIMKNNSHL